MNYLILMGSPRMNGNTASLLPYLTRELEQGGASVKTIHLHTLDLRPCTACRACQRPEHHKTFGCPIRDDMDQIFQQVLKTDCLILATPIYSWFCTTPMKAVLDRLVYGMNKFYWDHQKGPSLWAGKRVALLATCGYRPDRGADLWEEGMRRYCKHSGLEYFGMLAERDLGYQTVFLDEGKIQRVKEFAQKLLGI